MGETLPCANNGHSMVFQDYHKPARTTTSLLPRGWGCLARRTEKEKPVPGFQASEPCKRKFSYLPGQTLPKRADNRTGEITNIILCLIQVLDE